MEISKIETKVVSEEVFVKTPDDIVPLLRGFYKCAEVENFVVVALNGSYKVTSIRTVSVGTVNRSIVHPRDVFRFAVTENAAAVIISHNHPSGNAYPSEDDIKTTKRLVEAGEVVGIPVLDHIIIGNDYYSFNANGFFEEN